MKFKNCGYTTKIIQGVTFNPGDVKDVDFYITDKFFVQDESLEITKRPYTKKEIEKEPPIKPTTTDKKDGEKE